MGEGLIISETILLNVQFSFNALLISKFATHQQSLASAMQIIDKIIIYMYVLRL